jgi:hypothetical protein
LPSMMRALMTPSLAYAGNLLQRGGQCWAVARNGKPFAARSHAGCDGPRQR